MPQKELFKKLIGKWVGNSRTWFEPGKLADVSKITGEFVDVLDGRFVRHTYEGTIQGKPRHGEDLMEKKKTWREKVNEFKEHAAANSYMVIHGQRTDNDSKRKRKDGTLFDVWIIGAPIIYNGKHMGVYAIYRDITERKKAEEVRIRSDYSQPEYFSNILLSYPFLLP